MHSFQEITSDIMEINPFKAIGQDWFLLTAEKDGKVNTMTAAWGGLGVMLGKHVAYVVVRDSRYTKEFIDGAERFSMTFMDEHYKSAMKYLGAVSGRDEDKINNARLHVDYDHGVPFIDEGNMVFICRKMFMAPMKPEDFIDHTIEGQWYSTKDYHNMYIAEIEHFLAR